MADLRYKAYLSYSHEDARWATWLHRALEAYRVPARLSADVEGELPRRLAPIQVSPRSTIDMKTEQAA